MSVPLPVELGIVGGGAALGALAAGAGAARVVIAGLALKKRADALKELPIFATIAATQARLAVTASNVEKIDRLMARAQVAVAEIDAAKERVLTIGRTASRIGRTALAIASGISQIANPRGTARRIDA